MLVSYDIRASPDYIVTCLNEEKHKIIKTEISKDRSVGTLDWQTMRGK